MKTRTKAIYAAYGSNLNKGQMQHRCPGSRPIGTGWLRDYKLVFQGNSVNAHANVIPAKGEAVPIALWEITRLDEAALDRYEGVAGGYYTKEYMDIDMGGGRKQKALIYIMTPHNYGLPSASYLNTIAIGYNDFNFEEEPLQDAVNLSLEFYRKEAK